MQSARALASYGVASKEQREAIKEAIKGGRFTTAFGKTLKHLISSGVGLHHAGMLPRYRLLVEKLAQQGLLPVICGTDTLGVGINVPIHTVLLTGLTKFDGRKQRRLRSREFHQIAGRAGRSGFDTEGVVIAEAPEFEIENHKAELKAMGDPKKMKKLKKKRPPEGFVTWNEDTFTRLIDSEPETLKPRLRITHSMVLAEVEQGGDAWTRVLETHRRLAATPEEKAKLKARAAEIFATLIDAGVVVREAEGADASDTAQTKTTPFTAPAEGASAISLTEDPADLDGRRAADGRTDDARPRRRTLSMVPRATTSRSTCPRTSRSTSRSRRSCSPPSNFLTPRAPATRSISSRWSRPRWKTPSRSSAHRSAARATPR